MSLTEDQIQELKKDLTDMKRELESADKDALKEDNGELNSLDNHLADSASGLVNREELMAENHLKNGQLEDVNEALEKIKQNTYGTCVDTGENISFERLKAVPYAKRTVKAEEAFQEKSGIDLDDRGPTSRLQKPEAGMQDDKNRTLEEIEESHNDTSRPNEGLTKNIETPKGNES